LEDDVDISRGDMLVRANNQPQQSQTFDAMICWMDERKLDLKRRYFIRHTTRETRVIVKELFYRLDINTLHRVPEVNTLSANEIGRVRLQSFTPLFFDDYQKNRETGSFILIDESTHNTVAAGMIRGIA
jgi:sulfate adenylyltransferase subunit 1 (EFTu-like GTPase family)